ncbi:hypothetical protein W97_02536 [Coniosporium apollinis CBS 100218]|uniref:Uncharacterized protein n=1 Tax=Coniosporium apollinis (strain CBS 100218) TaxID=1168221 RepID=R7YNB6_CONA1|nr:uncharacterized protein W97_02536 [Coniosporium apollinis CBS 100218]EON63309.1 hypothetical protein W97_02536 [Coniosporium apollinis CBS 100218]
MHYSTNIKCEAAAQQQPVCYFSITPVVYSKASEHFSVETPACSPTTAAFDPETPSEPSNPLLALRLPPPTLLTGSNMDASKLMSLQTTAAFSPNRPKPRPIQDVLVLGESDSSESSTTNYSSDSSSSTPANPITRCSRCHRSSSLGSSSSTNSGMISFGPNSYYCQRCATIVGYLR